MTTVPQETRLVRVFPRGDTIHLRGCVRARRTVEWAWAEGRDDAEWLAKAWLKPCKVCLPDQRLAQDILRSKNELLTEDLA